MFQAARLRLAMVLVFALPLAVAARAANNAANNNAAVGRVGEDIRYLASDELKGRGPDTDGLQKAAQYIRDSFQAAGLKGGGKDGSFMQPFQITMDTKVVEAKTHLVLRGPGGRELALALGKDFQALATGGDGAVTAELVFAGYGISAPKLNYDDFQDADVAGKVIVIIRREPQQDNPKSAFDGKKVTTHSYIRTKLQAAKKAKAAAVLFINDPHSTAGKQDELVTVSGFGTSALGIPFAQLSQQTANQILAAAPVKDGDATLQDINAIERHIDENYRPLTQPLAGWTAELRFSFEKIMADVANVVGVLDGEGPYADETVVIGAHYDHLGFGPFGSRRPDPKAIHPGADDNASGTAAVMELARRFAQQDRKPPRRLVFIGFSAEERGLIGSNFYVGNPLFPLEKTVAMFNFDMIGQLRNDSLTVNGVPSADEFAGMVDAANSDRTLKIRKGPIVAMGDHFGFYQKGIPAVHFFTGLTKEYHTPDDTFATINVDGVVRTIDFAQRMVETVLAMPQRPSYVKSQTARTPRGGMAYLGVTPDYSEGSDGLKITDVAENSPALKGGLKADDVIVQFGDVGVADIQGLAVALRKYKAGESVKVTVKRGGKNVELTVKLGTADGK